MFKTCNFPDCGRNIDTDTGTIFRCGGPYHSDPPTCGRWYCEKHSTYTSYHPLRICLDCEAALNALSAHTAESVVFRIIAAGRAE